ncbi:dihydrodipicolinate synthase family protein [bacterium]|nr:dihydrodipicolinate synthase family protein [bacterium]
MRTLPTYMPALVTPYLRSGGIDPEGHAANVNRIAGEGIKGFVVAGSTGEGPYLEPGERSALCSSARTAAPKAFVMCGVAAESVRQAMTQIGEAADGGADAALVLTPGSLARGRVDLISGFYRAIADAAPIPILMYAFTRVAGWEMPTDLAAALSAHQNIVGMKDSNGNPARVSAVMAGAPSDFAIFAGATAAVSLSVAAGGYGSITASGNYAWKLNASVAATARRSWKSAVAQQAALSTVAAAIERYGLPATKHAAGLTGLATGPVRKPLAPPSAKVRAVVAAALDAAGLGA